MLGAEFVDIMSFCPSGASVASLVDIFQLQPHPEGGFYRESYRASGTIQASALPSEYGGTRNFSTAIYFLLPQGTMSRLHRIHSDEIWHFYLGGPLTIVQIFEDGRVETVTLGPDVLSGERVQHVVPGGCWFGAFPGEGSPFSFVGCTVAPGFDFNDFELADRSSLLSLFPDASTWIEKLTEHQD